MGGDMTGKSPTGRIMKNWRGEDCMLDAGYFFLVLRSLVLGVLVNHCRGHWVAGGFGHGGQDSLRYPGAREPDRTTPSWLGG
jgi:hypothetical protein